LTQLIVKMGGRGSSGYLGLCQKVQQFVTLEPDAGYDYEVEWWASRET